MSSMKYEKETNVVNNDFKSLEGGGSYQNTSSLATGLAQRGESRNQPPPLDSSKNDSSNLKEILNISGNKLTLTIAYCISFWNFGICVALFGPTLIDLACQTSSTLSAMSLLYFMQNFCSLLGCFLSGVLVKNRK